MYCINSIVVLLVPYLLQLQTLRGVDIYHVGVMIDRAFVPLSLIHI